MRSGQRLNWGLVQSCAVSSKLNHRLNSDVFIAWQQKSQAGFCRMFLNYRIPEVLQSSYARIRIRWSLTFFSLNPSLGWESHYVQTKEFNCATRQVLSWSICSFFFILWWHDPAITPFLLYNDLKWDCIILQYSVGSVCLRGSVEFANVNLLLFLAALASRHLNVSAANGWSPCGGLNLQVGNHCSGFHALTECVSTFYKHFANSKSGATVEKLCHVNLTCVPDVQST